MGGEGRRFHRVADRLELRYRRGGAFGEPWRQGTMVNLSAGGLRFLGEDPFEAGTPVNLQLQLPADREPTVLSGQVVWSRWQAPGVAEVGVELVGLTGQQQDRLERLVQFLLERP